MKTVWILITLTLLLGCAGEDINKPNTTPPTKPTLYPHQGDTGDLIDENVNNVIVTDTLNFYQIGDGVFGWFDGRENNGIDAVAGLENTIQIQWSPLVDTDLSRVDIWRFNTIDNDTLRIGSPSNLNATSFNDQFHDFSGSPVGRDWFYYIDIYNQAGINTVSDTVCYHLLDKPQLTTPQDGISVNDLDEVTFSWLKSESNEILSYRLLVFDEERNLLWVHSPLDLVESNEFAVPYEGEPAMTGEVIWRVDAFGNSKDLEINGTMYTIPAGSESVERKISIN